MEGYKMISDRFLVTNPTGLDLRCTRNLVQTVLPFQAEIQVKYRGEWVDGKSVLDLMVLGVACGAAVDVIMYGRDAQKAHQAMRDFFNHASPFNVVPQPRECAVA